MAGPVRPPLRVIESDDSVVVFPTNKISFNAADFAISKSGTTATISIDGTGTGAALTDTHIGFGNASNLLTGSANFTFVDESGGNGPTVLLTGDKPVLKLQDDTDATTYRAEFLQSGASQYINMKDSTGTNNEMFRIAPSYIAMQRSMTANVGIGTVPATGVALHIKDDESDTDNVVVRIQDASVDSIGDQVAIEGYWNTAQAGVIQFELRDTTTAASALVFKLANDAGSLTEFLRIDGDAKAVTFNEQSEDVDFRVETLNNGSTLRIVGSQDNVGIGGIPDAAVERLEIKGTGTGTLVRLTSTDDGSTNAPDLELFRDSDNPASADYTGAVSFSGYEDTAGSSKVDYARIDTRMFGLDASESGALTFYTRQNNALRPQISANQGGVAINENHETPFDFVIESSESGAGFHNLYADSGQNNIGLGCVPDSGVERLHVKGTGTGTLVRLESTDSGSTVAPNLQFFRNSGTPAVSDQIGAIEFTANDDGGAQSDIGRIYCYIEDETALTENGVIILQVAEAGSLRNNVVVGSTLVSINASQRNVDFRVMSDDGTNNVYSDAGTNQVGIGSAPDSTLGRLQVNVGNSTATALTLISTDADAAVSPILDLYRNSGTPADGDDIGNITFSGEDDGGAKQEWASISAELQDASAGSEDARLRFYATTVGATAQEYLRMGGQDIVFNEGSGDINFRVESNGNANMFKIDGGLNLASFGAAPVSGGATLQVPNNTISSYANVVASTTSPMTLTNDDLQSMLLVHTGASALTVNLPLDGGTKGQYFRFVSTSGDVTIVPSAVAGDTINGGTASLTRSTNNEIYDCVCIAANTWILSNPA
jgi:hypothetical protein